jgi:hypothetical protein
MKTTKKVVKKADISNSSVYSLRLTANVMIEYIKHNKAKPNAVFNVHILDPINPSLLERSHKIG